MPVSDHSNLPQHVAIIMDGNGRWAQERGLDRLTGHQAGTQKTDEIITCAREAGIVYLTLYAFSKENWSRPADEVSALMNLLKEFLLEKERKMMNHGIRLNVIGNVHLLPPDVKLVLDKVLASTSKGKGMTLTLALSYGSRDEIVRAISRLLRKREGNKEEVSEEEFELFLDTTPLPDPDLIIRTSGEYRISNFLLWQGAYAEYMFEECNWPDYTADHFRRALMEYQRRERRYGMTREQVKKNN